MDTLPVISDGGLSRIIEEVKTRMKQKRPGKDDELAPWEAPGVFSRWVTLRKEVVGKVLGSHGSKIEELRKMFFVNIDLPSRNMTSDLPWSAAVIYARPKDPRGMERVQGCYEALTQSIQFATEQLRLADDVPPPYSAVKEDSHFVDYDSHAAVMGHLPDNIRLSGYKNLHEVPAFVPSSMQLPDNPRLFAGQQHHQPQFQPDTPVYPFRGYSTGPAAGPAPRSLSLPANEGYSYAPHVGGSDQQQQQGFAGVGAGAAARPAAASTAVSAASMAVASASPATQLAADATAFDRVMTQDLHRQLAQPPPNSSHAIVVIYNNETFKGAQIDKRGPRRQNLILDRDGRLLVRSGNPDVHVFAGEEPDAGSHRMGNVRINVRNLTLLAEYHLNVVGRMVIVSENRAKDRVSKLYKTFGYDVLSALPPQTGDKSALETSIASRLEQAQRQTRGGLLVVVIDNLDADPELRPLLESVLRAGMRVRVWTWSYCASPTLLQLARSNPRAMDISLLDNFRGTVAYAEGDPGWGEQQLRSSLGLAAMAVMRRKEILAEGFLTSVVGDVQQTPPSNAVAHCGPPVAHSGSAASPHRGTRAGDKLPPPSGPYFLTEEQRQLPVYIYIDNSNIFGGAQLMDDGTKDTTVRVNIRKLIRLVEHDQGRQLFIVRRFVAGSFPPANSRVWEIYRTDGYEVMYENSEKTEESYVDHALHASILTSVAKHKKSMTTPGNLILLTGDANSNSSLHHENFTKTLERIADSGDRWHVHVWAWRSSTAARYRDLSRDAAFEGRIHLHALDDYRDEIIFREGVPSAPAAPTALVRGPDRAAPTPASGGGFAGMSSSVMVERHPPPAASVLGSGSPVRTGQARRDVQLTAGRSLVTAGSAQAEGDTRLSAGRSLMASGTLHARDTSLTSQHVEVPGAIYAAEPPRAGAGRGQQLQSATLLSAQGRVPSSLSVLLAEGIRIDADLLERLVDPYLFPQSQFRRWLEARRHETTTFQSDAADIAGAGTWPSQAAATLPRPLSPGDMSLRRAATLANAVRLVVIAKEQGRSWQEAAELARDMEALNTKPVAEKEKPVARKIGQRLQSKDTKKPGAASGSDEGHKAGPAALPSPDANRLISPATLAGLGLLDRQLQRPPAVVFRHQSAHSVMTALANLLDITSRLRAMISGYGSCHSMAPQLAWAYDDAWLALRAAMQGPSPGSAALSDSASVVSKSATGGSQQRGQAEQERHQRRLMDWDTSGLDTLRHLATTTQDLNILDYGRIDQLEAAFETVHNGLPEFAFLQQCEAAVSAKDLTQVAAGGALQDGLERTAKHWPPCLREEEYAEGIAKTLLASKRQIDQELAALKQLERNLHDAKREEAIRQYDAEKRSSINAAQTKKQQLISQADNAALTIWSAAQSVDVLALSNVAGPGRASARSLQLPLSEQILTSRRTAGDYVLGELLRSSPSGNHNITYYQAEFNTTLCVMKRASLGHDAGRALLHEAQLLGKLDNPFVQRHTAVFIERNDIHIEMPFVQYGTLGKNLLPYEAKQERAARLTSGHLHCIALQVCSALVYLSQCRVVHGALSLNSVLVMDLPYEPNERHDPQQRGLHAVLGGFDDGFASVQAGATLRDDVRGFGKFLFEMYQFPSAFPDRTPPPAVKNWEAEMPKAVVREATQPDVARRKSIHEIWTLLSEQPSVSRARGRYDPLSPAKSHPPAPQPARWLSPPHCSGAPLLAGEGAVMRHDVEKLLNATAARQLTGDGTLGGRTRYFVMRVERIEHPLMWQRYAATRQRVAEELSRHGEAAKASRQWRTSMCLPKRGPLAFNQLDASANEVFAFLGPVAMDRRDITLLQGLAGDLRDTDLGDAPVVCAQDTPPVPQGQGTVTLLLGRVVLGQSAVMYEVPSALPQLLRLPGVLRPSGPYHSLVTDLAHAAAAGFKTHSTCYGRRAAIARPHLVYPELVITCRGL